MAKSSRPWNDRRQSKSKSKGTKDRSTIRNSRTTVSGPAAPDASGGGDVIAEKAAATQDVSSAFTFNRIRELPEPMPKVTRDVTPEVSISPALSLFARPGDGSIRTRRVAIVVADGCDGEAVTRIADWLTDAFVAAIAKHRHFARETHPPRV